MTEERRGKTKRFPLICQLTKHIYACVSIYLLCTQWVGVSKLESILTRYESTSSFYPYSTSKFIRCKIEWVVLSVFFILKLLLGQANHEQFSLETNEFQIETPKLSVLLCPKYILMYNNVWFGYLNDSRTVLWCRCDTTRARKNIIPCPKQFEKIHIRLLDQ